MIHVGDKVEWPRYTADGITKHKGTVLAYVKYGQNIYDVCAKNNIAIERPQFGSDISINNRCVVEIYGGAKGTLRKLYAPSVGKLMVVKPANKM